MQAYRVNSTAHSMDDFYPKLNRLAVPLTLQFLFTASFSLIDSIMVASLGEKAIAAVGIAGQFEFLLTMILAGVLSGPAIFIAQYYGTRDYTTIKKLVGLTLLCAWIISFLYFLMVTFFSSEMITLFTRDEDLQEATSSFISLISYGYMASAVTSAFALSLKSIGVVKKILYISIGALFLNTLLNYILINGHFGFPSMGIEGAAIATLLSKILSMLLTVLYVYLKHREIAVSMNELWPSDRRLFKSVFQVTLPVMIHEAFWGFGTTLYMVAFGFLGTSALAIIQITNIMSNFVMAGVQGFSHAASVMIGELIGRKQVELAQRYAKRFTVIAIVSALTFGFLLFVTAPFMIRFFQISPSLHDQAVLVIRISACVLLFKFLNNIWIVGVFRSGGDTRFSMIMVLGSIWLIGLPLTFSGAWMKWPLEIVFILSATEEIAKATTGYLRFKSNSWQHYLIGKKM
ncbi:MATE family efflux transporter [Brevibacillus choshinensis]|uniref:MATE family efflux transporter n=1 Tax=Brevibacillus choshinensis TaxID=54911 RepID=UPI002E20CA60|nr:MATE family efflux transporter [Brevibacillus choshinensis]